MVIPRDLIDPDADKIVRRLKDRGLGILITDHSAREMLKLVDRLSTSDDYLLGQVDTADAYPLGGSLDTVGATEAIIGRWMKARGNRDRIIIESLNDAVAQIMKSEGGIMWALNRGKPNPEITPRRQRARAYYGIVN